MRSRCSPDDEKIFLSGTNKAIYLLGVRRPGKSRLLKHIIDELKRESIHEDQIIHMNFEDYEIRRYKDESLPYDYKAKIDFPNMFCYLMISISRRKAAFTKIRLISCLSNG
jgi:predicted AAA+ superfamily ATPase